MNNKAKLYINGQYFITCKVKSFRIKLFVTWLKKKNINTVFYDSIYMCSQISGGPSDMGKSTNVIAINTSKNRSMFTIAQRSIYIIDKATF